MALQIKTFQSNCSIVNTQKADSTHHFFLQLVLKFDLNTYLELCQIFHDKTLLEKQLTTFRHFCNKKFQYDIWQCLTYVSVIRNSTFFDTIESSLAVRDRIFTIYVGAPNNFSKKYFKHILMSNEIFLKYENF